MKASKCIMTDKLLLSEEVVKLYLKQIYLVFSCVAREGPGGYEYIRMMESGVPKTGCLIQ